jgi:hypothetical protein
VLHSGAKPRISARQPTPRDSRHKTAPGKTLSEVQDRTRQRPAGRNSPQRSRRDGQALPAPSPPRHARNQATATAKSRIHTPTATRFRRADCPSHPVRDILAACRGPEPTTIERWRTPWASRHKTALDRIQPSAQHGIWQRLATRCPRQSAVKCYLHHGLTFTAFRWRHHTANGGLLTRDVKVQSVSCRDRVDQCLQLRGRGASDHAGHQRCSAIAKSGCSAALRLHERQSAITAMACCFFDRNINHFTTGVPLLQTASMILP